MRAAGRLAFYACCQNPRSVLSESTVRGVGCVAESRIEATRADTIFVPQFLRISGMLRFGHLFRAIEYAAGGRLRCRRGLSHWALPSVFLASLHAVKVPDVGIVVLHSEALVIRVRLLKHPCTYTRAALEPNDSQEDVENEVLVRLEEVFCLPYLLTAVGRVQVATRLPQEKVLGPSAFELQGDPHEALEEDGWYDHA